MNKTKYAAEIYSIYDFIHTPENIVESFRRIREIGYDAVEISGVSLEHHDVVLKAARANGLQIIAAQNDFNQIHTDEGIAGIIQKHLMWDCHYVCFGNMPNEYKGTKEGFTRFARESSAAGEKFAAAGLQFAYHNYPYDMFKVDGKTGFDIILEESDKRFVQFQMDMAMMMKVGVDPVPYIYRLVGRMDTIHFKDFRADQNGERVSVAIGEGNFDWPAILRACEEIGVKCYVVEFEVDTFKSDPFEGLAISLHNLKALSKKG